MPNTIVEQRLKDIERAYSHVTEAINKNVATSLSSIKSFREYLDAFGTDYKNLNPFNGMNYSMEYQYQNALLEKQSRQANEELYDAYAAYEAAASNYNSKQFGDRQEMLMAQEAFEQAKAVYEDKLMNAATTRVNNLVQAIKNADNYFKDLNSTVDAMISGLNTAKEYTALLYDKDSSTAFSEAIKYDLQLIDELAKKRANAERELKNLEKYVQDALNSGTIVEGDSAWRELQTMIQNNKNELAQVDLETLKLSRDIANMPMEQAKKAAEELAEKHRVLNSAISDGVMTSESMIQVLNRLNKQIYASLGNIGQISFNFESQIRNVGEALNKQLGDNIDTLNQKYDALQKATAVYNAARDDGSFSYDDLVVLEDAMKDARKDFLEEEHKTIADQNQKANQLMTNIREYYDSYSNYFDALAQKAVSTRTRILNSDYVVGNQGNIAKTYATEAQNIAKE